MSAVTQYYSAEILSVTPNGSVDYDGRTLEQGFIVDNKVFVVDEGGVESFFNNTGMFTASSYRYHTSALLTTIFN